MAWVGRLSDAPFDPAAVNPTMPKADRAADDPGEPSDAESAQGWAMLEAFFRAQAKDRAAGG